MSNCALTKAITKVSAVISFRDFDRSYVQAVSVDLDKWLQENASLHAWIIHDRDLLDDGCTFKTLHMHIVFQLSKKKRASTIINALADIFAVSPLAVSVEQAFSIEGAIQYLVHKNQKDKHQYSVDDIHTDIQDDEMSMIMDTTTIAADFDRIKGICYGAEDLLEVIEKVGMSTYQHYRATILDIYECCLKNKRKEVIPPYEG